jgi:predicted Holliday junction resolvase-like endonuclease
MEIYLFIVILALLAVIVILLVRPRKMEIPAIEDMERKLLFALASEKTVKEVQDIIEKLPHDVVQSLTRSLATRTGKLNELLATLEFTQYDRLFYLGDPIDFVGVRYGETVDFIEVKTGKFRLSDDEKKLRELIEAKQVNYVALSVEKIGIAEEVDIGREET